MENQIENKDEMEFKKSDIDSDEEMKDQMEMPDQELLNLQRRKSMP